MEPLSGESGNISKRLRDLLSYHCFNGAALRRERKLDSNGALMGWYGWLQWSRSPERAETHRNRRIVLPSARLQWSRSPERAETVCSDGRGSSHGHRFNGAALRRERKPLVVVSIRGIALGASMEPLSGESGNRQALPGKDRDRQLQWSRSPERAETFGDGFLFHGLQ